MREKINRSILISNVLILVLRSSHRRNITSCGSCTISIWYRWLEWDLSETFVCYEYLLWLDLSKRSVHKYFMNGLCNYYWSHVSLYTSFPEYPITRSPWDSIETWTLIVLHQTPGDPEGFSKVSYVFLFDKFFIIIL